MLDAVNFHNLKNKKSNNNIKEDTIAKNFDRACVELGIYNQKVYTGGIPLPNGGYGKNDEEGATDRICCHKGTFIAVELKRPKGGVYSKKQLLRKLRIEVCGGKWFGISTVEHIQEFKNYIKSL